MFIECISDYQVDETPVASEGSTTLVEEDGTDMEMFSSQLADPKITTYHKQTHCSDIDRRTYVTTVTLPAIQKRKKVGPPIPKYCLLSVIVSSLHYLIQDVFGSFA